MEMPAHCQQRRAEYQRVNILSGVVTQRCYVLISVIRDLQRACEKKSGPKMVQKETGVITCVSRKTRNLQ
jgi:hypothetical protein